MSSAGEARGDVETSPGRRRPSRARPAATCRWSSSARRASPAAGLTWISSILSASRPAKAFALFPARLDGRLLPGRRSRCTPTRPTSTTTSAIVDLSPRTSSLPPPGVDARAEDERRDDEQRHPQESPVWRRGHRQPAVVGVLRPDRDQVLLLRQPADRVQEQIAGCPGCRARRWRRSRSRRSTTKRDSGLRRLFAAGRRVFGASAALVAVTPRRWTPGPSCRPCPRSAPPAGLQLLHVRFGPAARARSAMIGLRRVTVDAAGIGVIDRASGNAVSSWNRSVIGCDG